MAGDRGHHSRPAQWRGDRRPADPVRVAAYDVLRAVEGDGAYANLVAPRILADAGLSGRDAGFATTLAYGTLRRRGLLDAVLAACVDRPLAEVDVPLLDVLRLGAYQLLFLGTPPHAAVGETVQVARLVGGESRARFVNAVLRRVGERDLDDWVDAVAPDPQADPVGHLSVVQSHPAWIVEALHDSLSSWTGEPSWADTEDLLVADNENASVTLVARPGRIDVDELLDLPGTSPGRWSPYAVALDGGAPSSLGPVRSGAAGVQDEGSQLVALALARADVGDGPDSRWLDMAAGPGGKAALLVGLGLERGAALLAGDRTHHRAQLVAGALRSAPGHHLVVTADGTSAPWREGSFDRVLLDAPCTGLGVLRRRPESRWRRSPSDVAELSALQRALLSAALRSVRIGGVVGYATCSPHLAETTAVVDDAVRAGGVERLDVRPLLPEVDDLGEGPDLRLWPHIHGTDGMYLALLRRTG
ncbi:MAG: rRNA cytosine-C5-methyltransferase [Actinobacteria bacterium]|nr:rRNA cytosine-C5-methyltransferase [Actinomycetota bacterium]